MIDDIALYDNRRIFKWFTVRWCVSAAPASIILYWIGEFSSKHMIHAAVSVSLGLVFVLPGLFFLSELWEEMRRLYQRESLKAMKESGELSQILRRSKDWCFSEENRRDISSIYSHANVDISKAARLYLNGYVVDTSVLKSECEAKYELFREPGALGENPHQLAWKALRIEVEIEDKEWAHQKLDESICAILSAPSELYDMPDISLGSWMLMQRSERRKTIANVFRNPYTPQRER